MSSHIENETIPIYTLYTMKNYGVSILEYLAFKMSSERRQVCRRAMCSNDRKII